MAKADDKLDKDEVVQRTTPTGKAPKKRIANAKAAHAIAKRMKNDGEEAAYTRASIQGLYDGNPPWSRAEMKRRGYGWMANVDWGEFRNTINLTASSIWNMFVNVPVFISAKTDIFDPQNPDNDYGMIISLRFSEMLKKWKPFRYDVMRKILDMLKFGVAASFWMDDVDWRSKPVRTSNLMIQAKSECRPGELKIFGIRDEMAVDEIYDMIEGEDIDDGWNVSYTRKKIVEVVEKGTANDDRYNVSDWESLQQMVKNQDDAWDTEFDGLKIIHLFSEEMGTEEGYEDRLVSHNIILESDDTEEKNLEYLYTKHRRFDSIQSVLDLMLYNISDGWIKSVKGLGREIFHPSHASNRMLNSMLDGVVMGSGLLVQMLNAQSASKFNVIRKGPVTMVPEDVKLQQQQMQPSILPTVQARGIIQNVSNKNTGTSRGRGENLGGDASTAEQVRSDDANEADLTGNQSEWYYTFWEAWLQETFKRIMNQSYEKSDGGYKEHKWLMDKLKADGVPDSMLDISKWEITATRSIGMGNQRNKLNTTNSMVQMKGAVDEQGKKNIDREWFAARVGWENVDNFVPKIDRDQIPTLAHSMAESENIDMLEGHKRTVPVDDPHSQHWSVHMPAVMQIIKRFMAGKSVEMEKDVIAVANYLHHMGSHLQMLMQDPIRKEQAKAKEEEYKQISQAYQQMGDAAKAITAQREELAKKQQQTVEDAQKALASRDLEAAKYESDKKAEVAIYEADKLHEARMMKANTSIQAQFAQLNATITALNAKVSAEIGREDAKANAGKE